MAGGIYNLNFRCYILLAFDYMKYLTILAYKMLYAFFFAYSQIV
jgi:hypothetical protein